ncbi:unnamed protein product [Hapterophycus canaliculatus]
MGSDGGGGGGGGGGEGGAKHREANRKVAALKAEMEALQEEADAPGLSQAKAYALKKKVQMKRAAVIREERALAKLAQDAGR